MAVIRLAVIAITITMLGACGDAADTGGNNDGEAGEACTGEHLKLNYRECVGDEAYEQAWEDANAEAQDNTVANADPSEDDTVLGCDGDAVAHLCNYDEQIHDDQCAWGSGKYQGVEGAQPTVYCGCFEADIESDRWACD
ncbi:MAG: hypothetical protein ACLFVJ_22820 [Persicimonas sp.]